LESVLLRFFFLLSTIFWANFSFAGGLQALQVAGDNYDAKIFPLKLYVDHSQALTIDDIQHLNLENNDALSRLFIPAKEQANYWLIFQIHNQSDQPIGRIVKFDESFLYQADLYYQLDDQQWFHEENGLSVPLALRSIQNRLPSYRVALQPGETKTLYLMMNSKQTLLTVSVQVKSQHQFLMDEQFESAAYWLFFGMSLAILLYNLFLLLSLRDKLYFYYVLYCATFFIFVIMYSGFDLYLVTSAPMHYLLVISISFSIAFLSLFMRELLSTKNELPAIDLCFRFLILLFFAQGIFIAFNGNYSYLVIYTGMPSTLFFFAVCLYAFLKKVPLASYALFGLSWHLVGLFSVAGVNAGVLSFNFFTRYGFMIGSLIELFVFSLALAYRIQHLRSNQITIQSDLYLAEYKAKQKLEETVKKRTEELMNVNKRLKHLSQEDGLTGLFNRRFFDQSIFKEWGCMQRQKHSLCLVLADIDLFKTFNDVYGHQLGDQCLRLVSEVIKQSTCRSSDIAARYGGEEFVIILPDSDVEDGRQIAYKIQLALKEKNIKHEGSPMGKVTMSFGVAAIIPDDYCSIEGLIKSADIALYESKDNGRNSITIGKKVPNVAATRKQ